MPILYIRDELNQEWLPVVSELGAIPDITFPNGVENGYALVYHSGSGVWTAGSVAGGPGGVSYLDDLIDVDVPSPNNGNILQYNSSSGKWEAYAQSGSSGDMYKSVYDQDNDGVVDDSEKLGGQLPSYYSTTTHSHSGSYAEPVHTHTESQITDLVHDAIKIDGRDINTEDVPTDGQALVWNGSTSKWEYTTVMSGSGGTNATQLQGRDISDSAPSDLQYLGWNNSTSEWEPKTIVSSGSTSPEQRAITFYVPGYQYVGSKNPRIYFPFSSGSIQFTRCIGGLSTYATGSSLIFKIRRNGYASGSVDVCSVTIPVSTYITATDTITQPYWTVGYYLEVYVSQIGSTAAGANLSVTIIGRGLGLPT